MNEKKIFGTDGVRGKANVYPMTPETAMRIGKAVAHHFVRNNPNAKHKIIIGKDTRQSGYMFETALASGICAMGANVYLVGPLPTPAISHLVKSTNADAGIMITASHNPAEDNGIKIFDKTGHKLDDAIEKELEEFVFNGEDNPVQGKEIGKAFRIDDAKGRYIEFAKSTIGNYSLEGLKLVLDCGNGASYAVAETIFTDLGAEVIALNVKPDGMNINKECGAMHPKEMQEKVKEVQADLGYAFDGDADRIAVANEKGKLVDGDALLGLFALDLKERGQLKNNAMVATVLSNTGFIEYMKANDIEVKQTQVGDRYVIDEMIKSDITFGGEQAGHIIFSQYATAGDGILAGLQLARQVKEKNKKLSELVQAIPLYGQHMINIEVKEKAPLEALPELQNAIKKVEKKLAGKGRVLVRYSGTQNLLRVMVETEKQEDAVNFAEEIGKHAES